MLAHTHKAKQIKRVILFVLMASWVSCSASSNFGTGIDFIYQKHKAHRQKHTTPKHHKKNKQHVHTRIKVQGELKNAYATALSAVLKNPSNITLRKKLIDLSIKVNKLEMAWKELSYIARKVPSEKNIQQAINFSAAYGNIDQLRSLFEYIMIYNKVDAKVWLSYVNQLLKLGEDNQAIISLKYLLKRVPQNNKQIIANILQKTIKKARHDKIIGDALVRAKLLYNLNKSEKALAVLDKVKHIARKNNKYFWDTYSLITTRTKDLHQKIQFMASNKNRFKLIRPRAHKPTHIIEPRKLPAIMASRNVGQIQQESAQHSPTTPQLIEESLAINTKTNKFNLNRPSKVTRSQPAAIAIPQNMLNYPPKVKEAANQKIHLLPPKIASSSNNVTVKKFWALINQENLDALNKIRINDKIITQTKFKPAISAAIAYLCNIPMAQKMFDKHTPEFDKTVKHLLFKYYLRKKLPKHVQCLIQYSLKLKGKPIEQNVFGLARYRNKPEILKKILSTKKILLSNSERRLILERLKVIKPIDKVIPAPKTLKKPSSTIPQLVKKPLAIKTQSIKINLHRPTKIPQPAAITPKLITVTVNTFWTLINQENLYALNKIRLKNISITQTKFRPAISAAKAYACKIPVALKMFDKHTPELDKTVKHLLFKYYLRKKLPKHVKCLIQYSLKLQGKPINSNIFGLALYRNQPKILKKVLSNDKIFISASGRALILEKIKESNQTKIKAPTAIMTSHKVTPAHKTLAQPSLTNTQHVGKPLAIKTQAKKIHLNRPTKIPQSQPAAIALAKNVAQHLPIASKSNQVTVNTFWTLINQEHTDALKKALTNSKIISQTKFKPAVSAAKAYLCNIPMAQKMFNKHTLELDNSVKHLLFKYYLRKKLPEHVKCLIQYGLKLKGKPIEQNVFGLALYRNQPKILKEILADKSILLSTSGRALILEKLNEGNQIKIKAPTAIKTSHKVTPAHKTSAHPSPKSPQHVNKPLAIKTQANKIHLNRPTKVPQSLPLAIQLPKNIPQHTPKVNKAARQKIYLTQKKNTSKLNKITVNKLWSLINQEHTDALRKTLSNSKIISQTRFKPAVSAAKAYLCNIPMAQKIFNKHTQKLDKTVKHLLFKYYRRKKLPKHVKCLIQYGLKLKGKPINKNVFGLALYRNQPKILREILSDKPILLSASGRALILQKLNEGNQTKIKAPTAIKTSHNVAPAHKTSAHPSPKSPQHVNKPLAIKTQAKKIHLNRPTKVPQSQPSAITLTHHMTQHPPKVKKAAKQKIYLTHKKNTSKLNKITANTLWSLINQQDTDALKRILSNSKIKTQAKFKPAVAAAMAYLCNIPVALKMFNRHTRKLDSTVKNLLFKYYPRENLPEHVEYLVKYYLKLKGKPIEKKTFMLALYRNQPKILKKILTNKKILLSASERALILERLSANTIALFHPVSIINHKAGSDNVPGLFSDYTSNPPNNEITPEVRYIKNGVVQDINYRLFGTFFIKPWFSIRPLISISDLKSTNNNEFLTPNTTDYLYALTLSYYKKSNVTDLTLGYRDSLRQFAFALLKVNFKFSSSLLFIGRLGYNLRPYETTPLFVAGKKDLADFTLKYLFSAKNQISTDINVKLFYSQSDAWLATGINALIDFQHKFKLSYPDWTFNVFAGGRNYDDAQSVTGLMRNVFSTSKGVTIGAIIPASSVEGGFGFSFGESYITRIMPKWRPFASAQVLENSATNFGYFINVGIAGHVFGHDRLMLYASQSRGIEVKNQTNDSIKAKYQYYF